MTHKKIIFLVLTKLCIMLKLKDFSFILLWKNANDIIASMKAVFEMQIK